MKYKKNLCETVERMKRFWNLEDPIDRIPVIVRIPKPLDGADGLFFGKTDDYINNMEEYFTEQSKVMDDYIPTVAPQYGHALISALCGSQIRAGNQTVWSVPVIDDPAHANELFIDWDREWSKKILFDYEYLLNRANGDYYVGEYEIEGVSDTIAALRGAQGMLTDFIDDSKNAFALANRVTDILIEFAEWNHKNIGGRQDLLGGMSTVWSFWMPSGSGVTTEDHMIMASSEFYCKNIKPHTERLASSLTKTLMEIHAEGLRHIAAMGETAGIDLLTGCNPVKLTSEQRDDMRGLLGNKTFMIGARPEDIEKILTFTGLRGILLVFHAENADEANGIVDLAAEITQKLKRKLYA